MTSIRKRDIRKSNAHLIGKIGENFALQWLVDQGYTVCESPDVHIRNFARSDLALARGKAYWFPNFPIYICDHIKCKYHDTNPRKEASEFCKMYKNCISEGTPQNPSYSLQRGRWSATTKCPCLASFPEICEYCGDNCTTSKILRVIEKMVKTSTLMFPDFIAHKDNEDFLVEVKVNQGAYRKYQIQFMRELKKIGFSAFFLELECEIQHSIKQKLI